MERTPKQKPLRELETNATSVRASMIWELDFWASTAEPPKQHTPICSPRELMTAFCAHSYCGGAANYLEILTNETVLSTPKLGAAQAQLNELLKLVDIYKNLGSGWDA